MTELGKQKVTYFKIVFSPSLLSLIRQFIHVVLAFLLEIHFLNCAVDVSRHFLEIKTVSAVFKFVYLFIIIQEANFPGFRKASERFRED